MEEYFGKDINLMKLKKPVVNNLTNQVSFWRQKAEELLHLTKEVKECPICKAQNFKDACKIYGYTWRQCQNCTHVFNSRVLPAEESNKFYKTKTGEIKYSDTYTDPSVLKYRLDNVARPKVEFVEKFIRKGIKAHEVKWLDVGCGSGDILKCAKDKGYDVVGIEPNEDSAKYAREVYGVDVNTIYLDEYAKNKSKEYDVVTMFGLIDLVSNPMDFLNQANTLLKDDGLLAVSIPNYNSLSTAVQSTYNEQIVVRHMYPIVLNMYTLKSVEFALRQAGFKIEAMWFFGMDVYEMLNNLVLSAKGFEGSPLHAALVECTNELQRVFDSQKRCDKVHVVARKYSD